MQKPLKYRRIHSPAFINNRSEIQKIAQNNLITDFSLNSIRYCLSCENYYKANVISPEFWRILSVDF